MHTGSVLVVEPNIESRPETLEGVELVSFSRASKEADIQLLLVGHLSFKKLKPSCGVLIDTQGVWS